MLRLPRKLQGIFSENVAKALRLPHNMIFSRSATPATRNEATRRGKHPRKWPFRGRLRMVADGWATSSEHTLNPQTPRVKREPLLRIRERKGKEGKGRERRGQEGKGKERNGRERTGKEGKERERKGKKGKERERKGKDGKGRERKGKKGKGRERKGKKGKGRERKGKEGKERERKGKKGKGRERTGKEGKGRERKGEVDLEINRRRMTVLKWDCLAIAHCHSMFLCRAEKNEICSECVHNVHLLKRSWQEAKRKYINCYSNLFAVVLLLGSQAPPCLWHSIWHVFWHSIWHIFWHSFWHSIWHIFSHSVWHIFWHFMWHILWHSFWHSIWHIFWHLFWHSIWHIFSDSVWHIFWHSIWHIFWHSFWQSIWHIFMHSFWLIKSGGAQCDLELPVEVRQCTVRSGAPVQVWQCLVRAGPPGRSSPVPRASGAGRWSPAMFSAIWSAR